jgi:hypothetical protein
LSPGPSSTPAKAAAGWVLNWTDHCDGMIDKANNPRGQHRSAPSEIPARARHPPQRTDALKW